MHTDGLTADKRARKRASRLAKALLALGIACLLVVLMLRWFEHSQVYHPDRVLTVTGAELGRPFDDVMFKASDGVELNGWFYPAYTNSPHAGLVVLHCHGNAGNIGGRLDVCRMLLATGVNVLVFDYRGFGRSQGWPSEEGTYLDAQAAYQWLRRRGFPANRIIPYGVSLGGGVASELALREPVGGLVLQSTFTSVTDLGAEYFPWLPVRWLGTIRYDTRSKLPLLHVPVLIMHSRTDETVPFPHSKRNFAAANEPKLFCELEGGHNEMVAAAPEVRARQEQFLTLVESARDRPAPPR